MMGYLRQATASQSRAIGPFVDDTDFKTAETGLTIANTDIKLSANGGASANKNSGGGTHVINGVYGVTFDATDTATVGELFVSVKVAGALPVFHSYVVLEEAVYDALFAASAPGYVANAPVNVAQFGGAAGTFASGRPEVNASHIAGSAVSTAAAQIGVNVVNAAGTAWNSGAIGAATLAADTITAAKIAADAIGSSELAATAVSEIQAGLSTLDAAGVRSAVGMASANLDTQLGAIAAYIDTEVGTVVTQTAAASIRSAVGLASANLDTQIAGILTTAMTESYNTDGSPATAAQALYAILQRLTEFAISGTSLTVKKLDGTTTAFVLTLNDATNPSSSARTS